MSGTWGAGDAPDGRPSILDLLEDAVASDSRIRFGGKDDWRELGAVWDHAGELEAALVPLAGPTGVVAMALHASPACVAALLGAWRAGLTVASLPGPGRGTPLSEYLNQIGAQCAAAKADTLLVDPAYLPLDLPGTRVLGYDALRRSQPGRFGSGNGARSAGLVQYTSGSTSSPKGVCLDLRAIGANVTSILDHLAIDGQMSISSWLPLSHDMGLIGSLLTVWSGQARRWGPGGGALLIHPPEDFIRRPSMWLQSCSEVRATVSSGPDFALRLAARRVPADLDLSPLRALVVGAEPVRASTLRTFTEATASAGLSPDAICPAYGLAEASLAVTMVGPEEAWRSTWVDPGGLVEHEWHTMPQGEGVELVSAGTPLPGMDVRTSGGSEVGMIEVRGPSLLDEYLGFGDPCDPADGWFRTNDFGRIDPDGRLWIGGRTDDVIFVAGRNLYARDLEASLEGAPGLRDGCFAIVSDAEGRFVVVAEREHEPGGDDESSANAVRELLARRCGVGPSAVAFLPRGEFRKTPSGKMQRAKLSALYGQHQLNIDRLVRFEAG